MVKDHPVTFELVLGHLRKRTFAVLSTTDEEGKPYSAGVNYRVSERGGAISIFVMTRRHLKKARNVARHSRVSLVVPLPRRLLWFLPRKASRRTELRTVDAHIGRARLFS